MENYFSYFSTKICVVVTQKNHLIETVLLRAQNTMFKLIGKKIIAILRSKDFLIPTCEVRKFHVLSHIFCDILCILMNLFCFGFFR